MPPLRFALFGHPVSHSISPSIHRAAFAELGLPHTYLAIDLGTDEDLVNAMQAIRRGEIAGANVTAPHKRRALELADRIAPSAEGVGAANVLCRDPGAIEGSRGAAIAAHNTDVDALEGEIEAALGERVTRMALVLGAGGAALAAVVALKRRGCDTIGVTTRSFSSPLAAETLPSALRFRELGAVPVQFPGAASPSPNFDAWIKRASVIVQATSAGTQSAHDPSSGEALAALIPWDQVDPGALAFDLVYNPRVTPFLRLAEQRGLATLGGLGMLVRQAALSLKLWIGVTPPLEVLFAAAAEALG
jgi:shikimate dehydrogenase